MSIRISYDSAEAAGRLASFSRNFHDIYRFARLEPKEVATFFQASYEAIRSWSTGMRMPSETRRDQFLEFIKRCYIRQPSQEVLDAAVNLMRAYTPDQPVDESDLRALLGNNANGSNGLDQNTVSESAYPSGSHATAHDDESVPLLDVDEERGVVPPVPPIFYGREPELKRLRQLLGRNRLITLLTDGGTGKTSLAIKLGNDLQEQSGRYPHGIWFVELPSLKNTDFVGESGADSYDLVLVAQAVMQRLGLAEEPNQTVINTLLTFLKRRTLLLILDGCEQLAEACSHLADAILGAAEGVQIISTSRVPLHATGEIIFQVAPLPVPKPDAISGTMKPEQWQMFLDEYQAVKLFTARSKTKWVASDAHRLGSVCRRLGGVPLAIELAASRVNPAALVDITVAGQTQQYPLLSKGEHLDELLRSFGGGGSTVSIQQTLEATLDWAVSLLSDAEKSLYQQISMFATSFSLRAAENIVVVPQEEANVTFVQDGLANLVRYSLLTRRVEGSFVRYAMHDQVRSHAFRMLLKNQGSGVQSLKEVQRRYFKFYYSLVRQAERRLPSTERNTWLIRLDMEYDNIRAALAWALEQPEDLQRQALELAAPLAIYLFFRDRYTEGITLNCDLRRRYRGSNKLARASSSFGLGVLYRARGQVELALERLRDSVRVYEEVVGNPELVSRDNELRLAYARLFLALALRDADAWGNPPDAPGAEIENPCKLVAQALQKFKAEDDEWGIALAYTFLGACKVALADRAKRPRDDQEQEDTGSDSKAQQAAIATQTQQAAQDAREDLTEAFDRASDLQDVWLLAQAVTQLGILAFTVGDYQETINRFKQFLELRERRIAPVGTGSNTDEKRSLASSLGDTTGLLVRENVEEKRGIATSFRGIAAVLVRQFDEDGNRQRLLLAAKLMAVAEEVYRYLSAQVREYDPLRFVETYEKLKLYLTPEEWDEVTSECRNLTISEAIELVQKDLL
ncbi:MAG TPA: AAA family ATPase, partial [Chloroflexia bacterium]